jgi:hypothetical protein
LPLLLTVEATAIVLPVEAQLPGLLSTPSPTRTEVDIIEGDSARFFHLRADLAKEVMFLIGADEEGRGESVATFPLGCLGGPGEPHLIANVTPLLLMEGHRLEEGFYLLSGRPDDPKSHPLAVVLHGCLAQEVFAEGMDIGIKEKAEEIVALFPEGSQAIGGTRGAAKVDQDPHGSE